MEKPAQTRMERTASAAPEPVEESRHGLALDYLT